MNLVIFHRTRRIAAGFCLAGSFAFIIAVTIVVLGQTQNTAELEEQVQLSDQVQQRIKAILDNSSDRDVYVFDRAGTLKQSFRSNVSSGSFSASVLKSPGSVIKDCKKAVPTPPPGCVACESGKIVCSKKLQETKKKDPRK